MVVISKVRHSDGSSWARTGGSREAEVPCGGLSMTGLSAERVTGPLGRASEAATLRWLREDVRVRDRLELAAAGFFFCADVALFFLGAAKASPVNRAAAAARKCRRFKFRAPANSCKRKGRVPDTAPLIFFATIARRLRGRRDGSVPLFVK